MSATLINLIIQLVASAVGGNAAGAAIKNIDLGALDRRCAWRSRRRHGSHRVVATLAARRAASTSIVTAIVGVIKNAMAGQTAR
jgi:hypothetical protein